jgi:nucleotide-binding universal stress UspA family protein
VIRHILFATDGSIAAERAANYVAAIAYQFHAKVTILHTLVNTPVSTSGSSFQTVDAFADQKNAQELIERTVDHLRKLGVEEVDTQVLAGQPTTVILGVVETIQPDLLILGARGISPWKGLLLGSVSAAVVQRAEIPVLVVK